MGKGVCNVAVSLDGGFRVSHCTAAFLAGAKSRSKSMHGKSTADVVRHAVSACDPTCVLFKTNNKRFPTWWSYKQKSPICTLQHFEAKSSAAPPEAVTVQKPKPATATRGSPKDPHLNTLSRQLAGICHPL